jgi:hypothetical protein
LGGVKSPHLDALMEVDDNSGQVVQAIRDAGCLDGVQIEV